MKKAIVIGATSGIGREISGILAGIPYVTKRGKLIAIALKILPKWVFDRI